MRPTANGWTDLAQKNVNLKSYADYQLQLAMDGSQASVTLDGGHKLSYTFDAPLNGGMIGVGTNNVVSRFNNVGVLVLPPPVPLAVQDSFTTGVTAPTATQSGQWQASNGVLQGSAPSGSDNAITVWGFNVSTGLGVNFGASVNTSFFGGLIFDYQNDLDFKFVALMPGTHQLVLGHRDAVSWNFDLVINYSLSMGTNYALALSIQGSSVDVSVGGRKVFTWTSSTALNDGYEGFFTLKGLTTFDDLSLSAFVL